jgi:hypothetical protein
MLSQPSFSQCDAHHKKSYFFPVPAVQLTASILIRRHADRRGLTNKKRDGGGLASPGVLRTGRVALFCGGIVSWLTNFPDFVS